MKEQLLLQAEKHIHDFFHLAKLHRKKWYRELNNFNELLYAFFVVRRRMIQPKNYLLHESNRLRQKELKPEIAREYNGLLKALAEKGDLKKFHTENSKILYPLDGLLEEWNINHLHINRSRYQVFFMAEGKDIFVINICKHFERNTTGYHARNLQEIVRENWPDKHKRQRMDKSASPYISPYGQQKCKSFYTWLDDMIALVGKSGKGAELAFVDNEYFIIKSETDIEGTIVFEV